MTQIWQGDKVVAVTKVEAGPCVVAQIKKTTTDGYEAVQLAFGSRRQKNIKKPQQGHLHNLGNFRYLREFRAETEDVKKGDMIKVDTFVAGDVIDVIGITKGRGFQGVVKRYGFRGTKKTHGNKDQLRMPGSIGATGPAHVFKGTRMGGRMGGKRRTIKNLEIIEVDRENNLLFIKGAVPGARNGLVLIKGKGELKTEKAVADNDKSSTKKDTSVKENNENKKITEEKNNKTQSVKQVEK